MNVIWLDNLWASKIKVKIILINEQEIQMKTLYGLGEFKFEIWNLLKDKYEIKKL